MKKRFLILLFALATAVCLGVGLAACKESSSGSGDVVADVPSQSTETEAGTSSSTTKQAPVYQGMVISSANSASTLSSEEAVKSYAAMGGTANPTSSVEATGALTGDVNIEGVDIDTQIHLGGGDEPTIEDEITARFGVTGTGQSIYYADPGEEILITVKFSNPDDYEILSFRINGKTYASYMFQDGSDMENIIVKLDVGTKIGFADFTIDEIKYIDGTEIKDVMLNGETSVRCGIRTDDIPYATVIEETADIDTIILNIRIIDLYGLIEASDGYCFIALYDGDTMTVYEEYLHEGYNEIVFTGLDANTVYEYAVVAIYDNLSGDGENSINYLCDNCLRTEAVVLFDNVSVTKTGVSFSYLWYEGYEYAEIHKLSLESEGDTRLTLLESDATEITGLLSNTRYTLTASYTGPDGSVGSIHMSFTTLAMETPEITIDSVSATKTDITYSVTVTDNDTTGYVSSVAVIRDGSVVNGGLLLSGTVSDLLSNNEYTLVVTYAYDLNDGYGERTMEVTANVTTEAMAAPEFEIYTVSSTKEEISYVLYIEDADETGYLFSVELHMGKMLAGTLFASDGVFENLYSDTEYTIKAEYVYDLNDGYGARTMTLTETVSTKAKAVPVVSIDSLTSSKTGIEYGLYVYDADGVGYISSVTLTKGTSVLTGEASDTGTFEGLLSGNEYTLNVVYTYDLNDGTGEHTLGISKAVSTAAMTSPVFSVEYLKATKEGISYELYVSDTDGVGEITSVTLSKGSKTYTGSGTVGEFTDLLSDNEYTFTAVYTYNLNDGEGEKTIVITQTVSTLAKVTPTVSLESLSSTKTEVSYELYVSDADGVGEMTSVTLTRGSRIYSAEGYTGEFTDLLSDNGYTFTAVYTYDLNDGYGARNVTITKTISTQAVAAPELVIYALTSTTEEICYELVETDKDDVGEIVSIELYQGVKYIDGSSDITGIFDGLLSGVEYTLVVTYSYDLCDGLGTRTAEVTSTISTETKKTPTVEIYNLMSGKEYITYELAIDDTDGVGYVYSLTLSRGSLSWTVDPSEYGTFTNLLSDNEYTLTVVYVYDLNDGTGIRTISVTGTVSTLAKETPKINIYSLTSTKNSVEYEIIVTDTDRVGGIVSVNLTKGNTVYTADADVYGSFTGLLSDNEYTLLIVYEYDLDDGYGVRTLEVTKNIYTLAVAEPEIAIDSLVSSKDGIEYVLSVADEDEVGTTVSVTLMKGDETIEVATSMVGGFGSLLSDNEYTLNVVYTYDLCDGHGARTLEVSEKISTLAMELPSVTIGLLESSDEKIYYEYCVTDVDNVGSVTSITLVGANGIFTDSTESGVFTDLWSDNEYVFIITYTYNLNSGDGNQILEITQSVKTKAKSSPIVEVEYISSDTSELTLCVSFVDAESEGRMTNVALYNNTSLISETGGAYTGEISYKNLSAYTCYTLVVFYEYNLNDGMGTREGIAKFSYYTDPVIEFCSIDFINTSGVIEGDALVIQVDVYNPSNVTFTSVVVNEIEYEVSRISTYTELYVEIVNDGQFAGGDTTLTITNIRGNLGDSTYSIDISENNAVTIFVNGYFVIDDFTIVHDAGGREEVVEYAFKSEQIYAKIEVENSTGYDIHSVTLKNKNTDYSVTGSFEYYMDDFFVSEDKMVIYIPISEYRSINEGWETWSLVSIEYGNEFTGDKTKTSTLSSDRYFRLSTDGIVEIYTPEQLMEINGNESGYYRLMNNIDLSGYEWVNIGNVMYGVFDGNGYTISNMGGVASYENMYVYLGLFDEIRGIVKNLEICDVLYIITLNITDGKTYSVYAGVLAAEFNLSIVENCSFSSSFQITNRDGHVYIGSVFASYIATSYLVSCYLYNVVTEINAVVKGDDYIRFEGYIGSATGEAYAYDCSCEGNVYIEGPEETDDYVFYEGKYLFNYIDGGYSLSLYLGREATIVLPESFNGNSYTIGKQAFYQCTFLVSIIIPDSVTSIGNSAFSGCTHLASIIIPDSVTSIGTNAFYGCTSLTSVKIGEGVTSVGDGAFRECTNLTEIYFNAIAMNDLSSINRVFYNAGRDGSGITVMVGTEVAEIPAYLFDSYNDSSYAPYITTIVFTEGSQCTSIGSYAFAFFDTITTIELPNSVTTVNNAAFYNCTSLRTIYYSGNSSDWAKISIGQNNDSLTTATIYYYSEAEPTEEGNFWHYVGGEIVVWFGEEN